MTPKGKQQKRNRIPGISRYVTPRGETRWQAVLDAGDGLVRRQKRKRGFRTQDDAAAWQAEYRARLRRGEIAEPSQIPFRDYFAEWLAVRRSTVRPSTAAAYQQSCNQLGDRFLDTPLARITPLVIERAYGEMQERLQPTTLRVAHRLVRMVLRTAVRDGLLMRTPAEHVKPPGTVSPHRETWSAETARAFLSATESDPYGDAWRILLECWLRNGELRALRWSDIDLTAGTLSVRRTATRGADGRETIGPTKSGSSTRTIALSAGLTARLTQRRHAQRVAALANGLGWSEDRWVVPGPSGGMLHAAPLCRALRDTCARLGVPYIGVHGLRHTGGSLALGRGIDIKTISKRLGHENAAFTMQIYMHSDRSKDAALSDVMGEILITTDYTEVG